MVSLIKHTEGDRVHYLVSIGKSFDDRPVYLDATSIIVDAINCDLSKGYAGNGPAFCVERQYAETYASYVSEFAIRENLHKFDTKNYHLFIGSLTETELKTRINV